MKKIKEAINGFIKLLFCALCAAAVMATVETAEAQVGTQTTPFLLPNGTNVSVAALATNSYANSNCVFSATLSRIVGLTIIGALDGAVTGTASIPYTFDFSNDNLNWQSNAITISVTYLAGITKTVCTNLDTGGCPYFRLSSIGNTNAVNLTNLSVKPFLKPGI